ncbi:hypothetical protein C2845_PM07G04770 [Panicum miliaceum]|uniref:Uncharacterized protein n=1 Tax=Panicum miliaceum TaxID=4540 RepID=A0A3L6SRV9_PANMI|nr:hypothetical protein C2845_PM07G04770 [Panicum miliaceum]
MRGRGDGGIALLPPTSSDSALTAVNLSWIRVASRSYWLLKLCFCPSPFQKITRIAMTPSPTRLARAIPLPLCHFSITRRPLLCPPPAPPVPVPGPAALPPTHRRRGKGVRPAPRRSPAPRHDPPRPVRSARSRENAAAAGDSYGSVRPWRGPADRGSARRQRKMVAGARSRGGTGLPVRGSQRRRGRSSRHAAEEASVYTHRPVASFLCRRFPLILAAPRLRPPRCCVVCEPDHSVPRAGVGIGDGVSAWKL